MSVQTSITVFMQMMSTRMQSISGYFAYKVYLTFHENCLLILINDSVKTALL